MGNVCDLCVHLYKRQFYKQPSYAKALDLIIGYNRSGRVDMYINGQWGTVCDDLWTSGSSTVKFV